jgi:hypothetical protein
VEQNKRIYDICIKLESAMFPNVTHRKQLGFDTCDLWKCDKPKAILKCMTQINAANFFDGTSNIGLQKAKNLFAKRNIIDHKTTHNIELLLMLH